MPVCPGGICHLLIRKDKRKDATFLKVNYTNTPLSPRCKSTSISRENKLVCDGNNNCHWSAQKKNFMSFDLVNPVSKKLFSPWLLQTNNKWFFATPVEMETKFYWTKMKKQSKNYSSLMHWKQEMPFISIVPQPASSILILKVQNKMAHEEAPQVFMIFPIHCDYI